MFNGGHAPLPPAPKPRVVSQAPTLPPILIPHSRSTTAPPPSQQPSHFSAPPSSSGHYSAAVAPVGGSSGIARQPSAAQSAARAQRAAAATQRAIYNTRVINELTGMVSKVQRSLSNSAPGATTPTVSGAAAVKQIVDWLGSNPMGKQGKFTGTGSKPLPGTPHISMPTVDGKPPLGASGKFLEASLGTPPILQVQAPTKAEKQKAADQSWAARYHPPTPPKGANPLGIGKYNIAGFAPQKYAPRGSPPSKFIVALNNVLEATPKPNATAPLPTKVQAMINFANKLVGLNLPYVWGGGHQSFGNGLTGLDCSGFVSAVLHAGGYLADGPQTTDTLPGEIGKGLARGPGKLVTIYDRTAAGANGHVIIELNGKWYESGGGTSSTIAGVHGGIAQIQKPDQAYLNSFDLQLHPTGLGPAPGAKAQQAQGTLAKFSGTLTPVTGGKAVPVSKAPIGNAKGAAPSGPPLPPKVTPTVFAIAAIKSLGIKPTTANVQAFTAWEQAEGGHWNNQAMFNPINTKQSEPGSTTPAGFASPGIRAYSSWASGLQGTLDTLKQGAQKYGYQRIIDALKNNASLADFSAAVSGSSWGTGPVGVSGITIPQHEITLMAKQIHGLPANAVSGSAGGVASGAVTGGSSAAASSGGAAVTGATAGASGTSSGRGVTAPPATVAPSGINWDAIALAVLSHNASHGINMSGKLSFHNPLAELASLVDSGVYGTQAPAKAKKR